MSSLQEQGKNFPDPYPIRCEIALPGTRIYEHRYQNVYQEIWDFSPLSKWLLILD
jgi:hypothetical protein